MEIREAIKQGIAIEVKQDVYSLVDGRTVVYDRYRKGTRKWISSDGYAYRNFFEAYNQNTYFAKAI